jgi:hypothetical protein
VARRAALLREIVLAHPAVDFQQLVFLTQFTPHTVRNITRSYAWKHKPGGDIMILDDLAAGGPARPLLAGRLGPGYVWGLDLWWDADRVLFSYAQLPNWPPPVDTAHYAIEGQNVFELRKIFEPIRLYEAAIDGSQIVQLTDDPYWSDFEPAYTASGDVVFASDRGGTAPECGTVDYDHTNPNLYLLSRAAAAWLPAGRVGAVRAAAGGPPVHPQQGPGPVPLQPGRRPHRVHALGVPGTAFHGSPLAVDGAARRIDVRRAVQTAHAGAAGAADRAQHPRHRQAGSRRHRPSHVQLRAGGDDRPGAWAERESGLRIVTPGVKPQEGPMAGRRWIWAEWPTRAGCTGARGR